MKKIFFIILVFNSFLLAQSNPLTNSSHFAVINKSDSEQEIVRKAAFVVPKQQQYDWQKLEFIAFVHFGINTFTDREWGEGTEDPALFNPSELDAEQWAKTFKDAGMKLAILTAKHHDGFCLWPSKFTNHSVKNSPWKNGQGDVVREFVNACRKYGLKVGLYLSPWDRNNPDYGDSPKYNQYFLNQLRELLTEYGEITEVWFDGACGEGPNGKKQVYDWQAYYRLIRELQPGAVIFGMSPDLRWVGTETGYGRDTEWSVIPLKIDPVIKKKFPFGSYSLDEIYKPGDMTDYDLGSRKKISDADLLFWYPAETDVSIRPGWFYHPSQDSLVKSVDKLVDIYFNSVGKNGVFLLNVPPDKRGLIHQNDVKNLIGLKGVVDRTFNNDYSDKSMIKVAGEAIQTKNNFFGKNGYWLAGEENTKLVIEIELTDKATFDVVMLQEEIRVGQRIERFILEYWNGNEWEKFSEGTTVGYKRLLRFEPVTAKRIRIVIDESRMNPAISGFGLFKYSGN
ncbi:MAG TPA: alpha-L-fucosidase [Melioribacteraceae bacterium]|nr:alpha-L-fucosidase [Melioribacteraceae bacterium]